MNISFIILTWNSEGYIGKCLTSLFADLYESRFSLEIFVVDNGSKDSTIPIIKSFETKYPDHIIPIYLKSNRGTTYPRNLALKRAKGDYIIIIDSDVEILKGTIEKLINTHKNDEQVGLVVPKLTYPNGKLQKSTDNFPTIFTKFFRYFFLKKMEDNLTDNPGLREVDYAISAVWALKREVLARVGLLDENIFYAPEDVDYCLRIWRAGYKILYNPEVVVIHDAQEISRKIKINKATLSHIKGLFYYFRKHKYLFTRPTRSLNLRKKS